MNTDNQMDDPISKALELGALEKQSVRRWKGSRRGSSSPRPDKQLRDSINDSLLAASNQTELDEGFLAKQRLLVHEDLDDAVTADRYRLLNTRIRQRMEPRKWSKIGITSASAQEGKTLTSLNLAITASRENDLPVVLIDGDTRRPSISNCLGFKPKADLVDYLNNKAKLTDVLYSSPLYPGLFIIPTREGASRAPLSNGRLSALMEELPSQDILTLIDLPPTLVADDVLLVAPVVDAMLLVIKDGQSNQTDLTATTDLLSECNILGTVLNCSQEVENSLGGYYYHQKSK